MRDFIKQLVRISAETLPLREPIYEFGSLQVPGQEGFADLRPFFPGKRYVGADMRPGPGVDMIMDLHHLDLPDESAGTVLSLDTFEHVEYPRKAVEEVHRILQPDGIFIVTSVMDCPIHDYPYDYWRFTPEGFRSLLNVFASSFIEFAGEASFPHTVVGIGFKAPVSENVLNGFKGKYAEWKRLVDNQPRERVKKFIKLFTPPILLQGYRRISAG